MGQELSREPSSCEEAVEETEQEEKEKEEEQAEKTFYYEAKGERRGPFREEQMLAWYRASFLPSQLRVTCTRGERVEYEETIECLARLNAANPFLFQTDSTALKMRELRARVDAMTERQQRTFTAYQKRDVYIAVVIEAFEEAHGTKLDASTREQFLQFAVKSPIKTLLKQHKAQVTAQMTSLAAEVAALKAKGAVSSDVNAVKTTVSPPNSQPLAEQIEKMQKTLSREIENRRDMVMSLKEDLQNKWNKAGELKAANEKITALEQKVRSLNGQVTSIIATPTWKEEQKRLEQRVAAVEKKQQSPPARSIPPLIPVPASSLDPLHSFICVEIRKAAASTEAKLAAARNTAHNENEKRKTEVQQLGKQVKELEQQYRSCNGQLLSMNKNAGGDDWKKEVATLEQKFKVLNGQVCGSKIGQSVADMKKDIEQLKVAVKKPGGGGGGGGVEQLREKVEQLEKDIKAQEQRYKSLNGEIRGVMDGSKTIKCMQKMRSDLDSLSLSVSGLTGAPRPPRCASAHSAVCDPE